MKESYIELGKQRRAAVVCYENLLKGKIPQTDIQETRPLKVYWYPQVPCEPFYQPVRNLNEALLLLRALASYDFFQLGHKIKPDYSNAGGLMVQVQGGDWEDWEGPEGETIDELDTTEQQ